MFRGVVCHMCAASPLVDTILARTAFLECLLEVA